MEFNGAKIAILVGDKILLHLRDDNPAIMSPNMWDCPGGGREGDETPEECIVREVKEELEIDLDPEDFIWKHVFKSIKHPGQNGVFMVTRVPESVLEDINLNEGQRWELFDQDRFFEDERVLPGLKIRFRAYLDGESSSEQDSETTKVV